MSKWDSLADEQTIEKTIAALKANGIEAFVVPNGADAKAKVLSLLPVGAEVMVMSSATLDTLGISKEINESGRFNSVKKKLMSLTDADEKRRLGAAPDWAVGSVHAVTEDGGILVASATGSQLPAYAFGAAHVIWVVGTQKIVKDMDSAMKRLHEHTFPLEDARARKVYGSGSNISKTLVINKEFMPGRLTLILVKEELGF